MEYSLSEIAAAVGGVLQAPPDITGSLRRIVTHSKEAGSESIFWALRGESIDGHSFVSDALARGAACVVAEDWNGSMSDALPSAALLRVPDTQQALARLANWNRRRRPVRVIGITGSFGKTTTREMVHAVLSSRYRTYRSPKNFNNHIGLPLTLLGLRSYHDAAVTEMGASGIGEITRLCEIAQPDAGIITGIGHAHCGAFGGPQAILQAKGELAEMLPGRGLLLLPADDPHCDALAERAQCRTLRVGPGRKSQLVASDVRQEGPLLAVDIDGFTYRVPIIGRHFARSVLFAVALGREYGLSETDIADGLRLFSSVPGRCQVLSIKGCTVIDDTYNASPEAMKAAIGLLSGWPNNGRRFFICGDMLELGDISAELHHDIGVTAAAAKLDGLFALGDQAESVIRGATQAGADPAHCAAFSTIEPLFDRLQSVLQPGDAVLIKGSRGMRMERVTDWLKAGLILKAATWIRDPHNASR